MLSVLTVVMGYMIIITTRIITKLGVTSLTSLIMVLKDYQNAQFCINYSQLKSLYLGAGSKIKLVCINS